MALALETRVAIAIEAGPLPCEAHQIVDTPMASADLREEDRCGKPDTALMLVGCGHEHVIELWMCPSCVGQREATPYCGQCFDGPERHVCPVLVKPAEAVTG